jgi:hypothetical protein
MVYNVDFIVVTKSHWDQQFLNITHIENRCIKQGLFCGTFIITGDS